MAPQLQLQAVAFISPQNHPILVRSFANANFKKHDDDLKYHYIAHTSLDVIDERSQFPRFSFLISLCKAEMLTLTSWDWDGDGDDREDEHEQRMLLGAAVRTGGRRCVWVHHAAEGQDRARPGAHGLRHPRRRHHHGEASLFSLFFLSSHFL